MIKVVAAGIWVCIITLGAVYFSVQMATKPPVDEAAAKQASLEVVKGESITVPLLKDGQVSGYFISRISFMMDKEKLKGGELPLTEYMTDELFSLLVGNAMIDITDPKAFKLDEFKKMVKEDLNKRLGEEYIADVLVEQLDYLSKDDIRIGQSGGKAEPPTKIVAPEAIPSAEAAPKTE
ncbi:hypothetical protein [Gellertiella hungarica]|uniref:Flagellar basal body-associated protein FliL n=1 Tax=Gellertiella hungarica TaxID=1572859 RepID=A0A7W6NK92_9HYPH|nr:hypothetical protein [Gellertiella hungarica]MBB4064150.1 flagellar basal body-associated protein FliL [Gellertiella hungarica]